MYHSTVSQVLSKTDVPSLKSSPADRDISDELKTSMDTAKGVSQPGLDVVDQISAAAGLQAKNKSTSSGSDCGQVQRTSTAVLLVTVSLLQLCQTLIPST